MAHLPQLTRNSTNNIVRKSILFMQTSPSLRDEFKKLTSEYKRRKIESMPIFEATDEDLVKDDEFVKFAVENRGKPLQ